MLGTNLTSSGHVVMLCEVLADGVILNDPYGFVVNGKDDYMKNGQTDSDAVARIEKQATGWPRTDTRLRSRSDLLATLRAPTGATITAFGEGVFYTWDEVGSMDIGKWNNATVSA